jgi:hypothetical protein
MTHDEMIEVIAAHRDKKDIQIREIGGTGWGDYSTEFKRGSLEELIRDLDTDVFEFRVKPEQYPLFAEQPLKQKELL